MSVLVAIMLLVIVAAPGAAQQRHYATITRCQNGIAVTEDSLFGFRLADSIEAMAHEAVHRRQLAGGCDSTLALWSRDQTAKMDAEAEAFCVGMRAAGLTATQRHTRAVSAAKWWSQFGGGESFAEYLARFDLWCLP